MSHTATRKLFPDPNEFDAYREQTAAFRRKFGREMGPDDPFFFDPEAETPQFCSPEHAGVALDLLATLMGQAGIDPAAVYAFKKTQGLLPTGTHRLTDDEMAEWDDAILEYDAKLASMALQ
jgi:hypothetical protein